MTQIWVIYIFGWLDLLQILRILAAFSLCGPLLIVYLFYAILFPKTTPGLTIGEPPGRPEAEVATALLSVGSDGLSATHVSSVDC